MNILIDRWKVEREVGTVRCEYRGRYLDGVSSDWVKDRSTKQIYPLTARHLSRIMELKPTKRGTNADNRPTEQTSALM